MAKETLGSVSLEHGHDQITIRVKADYIRDGTPGISLTANDEVMGEWTDSGVKSLSLNTDCNVVVRGKGGNARYLVTMPWKVVGGEEVSETEVAVRIHRSEME